MMRSVKLAARLVPVLAVAVLSTPATAQSARDLLMQAAFQDRSQPTALARVDRARALSLAIVRQSPDDQDAAIVAASALAYRAKLTGSRTEAIDARKQLEAVAARFPRNADAQLGLGGWHMGVIARVGRIVGRAVAGAQRGTGLAATERAVTLGGNRAFFAGIAGLLRIETDAADARGRALLEMAADAPTPTPLDRIIQRHAIAVLASLKQGDAKTAKALADRLLPFGWYDDEE